MSNQDEQTPHGAGEGMLAEGGHDESLPNSEDGQAMVEHDRNTSPRPEVIVERDKQLATQRRVRYGITGLTAVLVIGVLLILRQAMIAGAFEPITPAPVATITPAITLAASTATLVPPAPTVTSATPLTNTPTGTTLPGVVPPGLAGATPPSPAPTGTPVNLSRGVALPPTAPPIVPPPGGPNMPTAPSRQ